MGTLLIRQASSYLQEKYKAARLAFTDASEAELWTEQVTENNPWSPDTKIMTQLAEASYYFDEYSRMVNVLHKRFSFIDWKKWRQYYNSLVLLEFLITHGSRDFVDEFRKDVDIIRQLGTFEHTDPHDGVKWGAQMREKSERLLKLLGGSSPQQVRLKAIKLTNDFNGFGSTPSSTSSWSSSNSSPRASWTSSFDSYSSSSPWREPSDGEKFGVMKQSFERDFFKESPKGFVTRTMPINYLDDEIDMSDSLDWSTIEETFTDIDLNDNKDEKKVGFFRGLCTKHIGYNPVKVDVDVEKQLSRSYSDIKNEKEKILQHQHSLS